MVFFQSTKIAWRGVFMGILGVERGFAMRRLVFCLDALLGFFLVRPLNCFWGFLCFCAFDACARAMMHAGLHGLGWVGLVVWMRDNIL
jgi:hypothetical protein